MKKNRGRNQMKKILVIILVVPLLLLTSITVNAASPTTDLYIHYYRYDGDYTNWNVWLWASEPESLEGASYDFEEDDTDTIFNYGGVVAKISLEGVPGYPEIISTPACTKASAIASLPISVCFIMFLVE